MIIAEGLLLTARRTATGLTLSLITASPDLDEGVRYDLDKAEAEALARNILFELSEN